jgi:hypothetical protein
VRVFARGIPWLRYAQVAATVRGGCTSSGHYDSLLALCQVN